MVINREVIFKLFPCIFWFLSEVRYANFPSNIGDGDHKTRTSDLGCRQETNREANFCGCNIIFWKQVQWRQKWHNDTMSEIQYEGRKTWSIYNSWTSWGILDIDSTSGVHQQHIHGRWTDWDYCQHCLIPENAKSFAYVPRTCLDQRLKC